MGPLLGGFDSYVDREIVLRHYRAAQVYCSLMCSTNLEAYYQYTGRYVWVGFPVLTVLKHISKCGFALIRVAPTDQYASMTDVDMEVVVA